MNTDETMLWDGWEFPEDWEYGLYPTSENVYLLPTQERHKVKDVTVKKQELLKTLTENRDGHKEIFDEAMEGYKAKCLTELNRYLDQVQKGQVLDIYFHLPMPENHTKDYDRVIKMVEMNISEEFVLSETDFNSYVMDDWQWKRAFLTANASYSETATRSLDGL